MKKIKLLLAAAALMLGGSVWAQTDVTSTYITNADFSSTTGWTQSHSDGSYWALGNGNIGSYAVVNSKTSTTDATHLSTEYCFGMQCRWSTNYAAFTQTTSSLPVGAYTLTFDVQNTNSSTTNATYENRFTVTVGETTYTDSKTEWMRGSSAWTTHTIIFKVTEAAIATISLGYGTGSNNYASGNTPHLYVSHLKLEKYADYDTYLRIKNSLTGATYAEPVVTGFVVNGTFTDNVSGWTCNGGFQNQARASNQSGAFTVPFFENWNPSAKANKMSQTISDIPNGTYRLDIAAFVNTLASPNESQYVFANSDKTYLTTGDPTAYEVYTVVTTNEIEIGLEQTTATANWMGIDNVSLRYYGAGDVINAAKNAAHKQAWEEAVANANAALSNSDYANVTGKEKSDLETEVAKTEPTTAEGYDEAAAALTSATSAFTAAKTNYDIFATYNTTLAYADANKKPTITDETTAASIITALRAYYESHAMAEGKEGTTDYTSYVSDANADINTGWTNGIGTNSGQGYTDANGNVAAKYLDGGWSANAGANIDMTRNITLPAGTYLLTVTARGSSSLDTYTLSIGGQTENLPTISNVGGVFNNGWNDVSVEFKTNGSPVTLEVIAHSTASQQWISINRFRLVQLEANNDIALHKQTWEEAKAAAEAARDNSDYNNVGGSERATLLAEIAKDEPSTADDYDAAAADLISATSTFTAAKPAYDAYKEIYDVADALSVSTGSAPTTAAEAITATNTINVAVYNATTASNYFDITEAYAPSWSEMSTASGQHWSGDGRSYPDNWSANTNTTERTATVTLPNGQYVLMSAGRGSTNTVVTMTANGTTVTFASKGDTGYGIETSGVANFSDGTYANDNNGRGWEWRFIPVTLTTEAAVTITQTITRLSGGAWGSFTDFKILKVGVFATSEDYAALNSAINTAEAKTLGFENGQYAPYSNVAALTALAQAKAIDQNVDNDQDVVQAVTSELSDAIWTANDGDVDAIYNGQFAEANGTNPKGWTRSNNGWGQQITGLTAEANGVAEGTTTAWYYNTNGAWQYGNDGVYVMPLAANQAYELSFKYRKHNTDWQNWMKASVVNSSNEGMEAVEFEAAENGTTFVTAKAYFTTEAAGNYILSIEQYGNAHLTDVSLVKTASTAIALNEGTTFEPISRTYYETVNMTRTVKEGFNTVCLPFDLTAEQVAAAFGEDAKVYTYSESSPDPAKATINFNTKADNTIEANVPVLIGEATAFTGAKTFSAVMFKTGEAKVEGTNFDFVGTYAPTTVAEKDYFIGNGALYKSAGATSIKAFRAYIQNKVDPEEGGGHVKMFIEGEEIETGIETIDNRQQTTDNGLIYNLAGQRIQKMQKGINIVNGRKVLK